MQKNWLDKTGKNLKNLLMSAIYLVLDTETTGLNPLKNNLLQIAALALDSKLNILATFDQDICPPIGTEFCPVSSKIHNFSAERIQNGRDYQEICDEFVTFVKTNFVEKPVIIGQFYPFDYAFLNIALSKCDFFKDNLLGNNFIDTKALVNFANLKANLANQKKPFINTSLSAKDGLKDFFQIKNFASHDALGDCQATLELLKKLIDFGI